MESEEIPTHPDSTTKERVNFVPGEDVFVPKGGQLYLGTIVEVNAIGEKCQVKFLDNTSNWCFMKELKKLTFQSDVTCVLCKESQSKDTNSIIICQKCNRGYHQFCHEPVIRKNVAILNGFWKCRRCTNATDKVSREKKNFEKKQIKKSCNGKDEILPLPNRDIKLPYELNSLHWDPHHRVNDEQIYCYCGLNGDWYSKMLQCARCKQWFHEKCIRCLSHPLLSGDRFYIFICVLCNHGEEFIRRLELKWSDLVHLVLYNLTVLHAKKYYDLDDTILPYMDKNWKLFQLPVKMQNCSSNTRRNEILTCLETNKRRFKCGKEIKKRTRIWGLRDRLPPAPSLSIHIPPDIKVDDKIMGNIGRSNGLLQIPRVTSVKLRENWQEKLETKSIKDTSSDNNFQKSNSENYLSKNKEIPKISGSCSLVDKHTSDLNSIRDRFTGGGFVKKSVPFPDLKRKKRKMETDKIRNDSLGKKRKVKSVNSTAKKSQYTGAKFLKARKLLKIAIATKKPPSGATELPPTPPTSVSGPPTPSAPSSGASELSVPSSVDLTPIPLSTPADTSGDETSSRGTLDSSTPPPKNFDGKFSPFGLLLASDCAEATTSNIEDPIIQPSRTWPFTLKPVISQPPRPAKKQLSEKDIIIDKYGMVKRRKQRRSRILAQSYQLTASKTATYLPARNSDIKSELAKNLRNSLLNTSTGQIDNCEEYAYNGRKLRQRQNSNDKFLPPPEALPEKKDILTPSQKCSPGKQTSPEVSMNKLMSSVNLYFGTANRIAAGEQFVIKAKRYNPDGQIQYLIEWEGVLST